MALNEACQLWIEQRIEEEQEKGTSHPEIGRLVGSEIMVMFETQIEARTLEQQSRRIATNVANGSGDEKPLVTPQPDSEIPEDSSFQEESNIPESPRPWAILQEIL